MIYLYHMDGNSNNIKRTGYYAMTKNGQPTFEQYEDYAQSANTLFHFMKNEEFLTDILKKHAIIPRYCIEKVDYLKINLKDITFNEIAVLQKCFCDIPFHKLADSFPVKGVGEEFNKLTDEEKLQLAKNNTHFDYYGKYAIAFSKAWGEKNNLQPVHYLNEKSYYTKDFINLLIHVLSEDDISEEYENDVLNRLAFIKPLRGTMNRVIQEKNGDKLCVEIYKNFHDEQEWRYVPSNDELISLEQNSVIANPKMISYYNEINNNLEGDKYRSLWLDFSYDEVKYIIVPDSNARISIIQAIMTLKNECFSIKENIELQKQVLISKILVLDEIRRDW